MLEKSEISCRDFHNISFFENLDRINAVDFIPTPLDIIMAYCPTTGVQNVNFTVKNHTYQ